MAYPMAHAAECAWLADAGRRGPKGDSGLSHGPLRHVANRHRETRTGGRGGRGISHQERNTERPGNSASAPSASSMRRSWLYFATRSERDGAPVLIWPHPVATARSAIVTSSVSTERCDMTAV